MTDAVLIFPPQWVPDHPYLSLPSLSSFLLERGFRVVQKDINVLCYNYFLSKGGLKKYFSLIDESLGGGNEKIDGKRRFYHTVGKALVNSVESAKRNLREGKNILHGFSMLRTALDMISSSCYPTKISFDTFEMEHSPDSIQSIKKGIFDSKQNIFFNLFENEIVPSLLSDDPALFAISVVHKTQVIPALTLAFQLKAHGEKNHVVLGGPFFSGFADSYWRLKEVFDFADSIIFFDGETALASLIECLEREQNLSTVPNLVFRDGDRIRKSEISHWEDMNALPTPVFEGLPLDKYFSPMLVLPLQTARGCYWARCAFCAVPYGEGSEYRSRDAALVAEDVAHLHAQYKTGYFELTDDAVPPQKLRLLSEELLASSIKWTAEVRLEKQFTRELLSTMYAAGCRILYFGLESANPRVLQLMEKGTDVKTSQRILSESHAVGIWNHVYVFFGFPTETEQEAEDTIQFVFKNNNVIDSVGFGYFVLCEGSKTYEEKEQFKIGKIIKSEDELSLLHSYIPREGMNQEQAKETVVRFHKETGEIFDSSFIFNFRWLSPLRGGYLQ